jgi:hypothetical protein
MTGKQYLSEVIMTDGKSLMTESALDSGGFYRLKGTFLEGEIENQNGRVYPKDVIEGAVNQLIQKIQAHGPVAGECDHPEGLNVNFDRISHVITDMKMDGNNGVGTMKVIKAGLGLIVGGAIEAGMQVGVSSRGSGNIDNNGRVSDFDIVTVDIVANPSAYGAYPNASLSESLRLNKHGKEALYLTEFVKNDPSAQRYFEQEITRFLTDVRDQYKWRKA